MTKTRSAKRSSPHAGDADKRFLRHAALRLGLQFSVVIVAIVALVGVIAFTLVSASIAESTNRALEAATQDLKGDEVSPGTYVMAVHDGRVDSSATLPSGLPDLEALHDITINGGVIDTTVTVGDTSFAVRTTVNDGNVVQVAIDNAESREEINRLLLSLLVAGFVGTLAAGVAAYLLARRAIKPLVDSLSLQRRFVADASHELRTPLTLLSTRVQMFRRALLKEGNTSTADEIAQIDDDAKALTGILDDLLISSDHRDTGLVAVDLGRLAAEAIGAVTAAAQELSIRVTADIPRQPLMIAGLEAPLRRVYFSLLSNALDHAASTVVVHVTGSARMVAVEVADDGPGFPQGTRPFERFSSDRPASIGARHYGLGLALAADVATRFGGKIGVVTSRPGGIIRLEFPRLSPMPDNEHTP